MNANRTPEQIEADINDVRERVDSTLGTLERRQHAKKMLLDGIDHLRNGKTVRHVTTAVMSAGRTAREHPLPAALAGAGLLGLLVWGLRSGSHSQAERHAMRHVSEAVDMARDRLMSAKQALADATRGARRKTRDTASQAWKGIEHAGSEARSAARDHPVAAGALGIALLAIAAAAAIPSVRDRIVR